MSEHTYEFINEIDLTKLESEETRAMTVEEQQIGRAHVELQSQR